MQVYGLSFAMDDKMECKSDKKMMEEQAKHLEKMTKDLNLTPDQKSKVEVILKEKGDKMKAEMQKMQDDKKAIKDEADQKIKDILTPEQLQKFDKIQAEHKAKMEKKMKKGDKDKDKGAEVK